jgi:hypothetical protein
VVAAAQARGLGYEAPYEGGRLRPDGEQLRWRNARAHSQDLPFLCGDLTPRALRVPEGQARVHPNGATGVARLEVAVQDLQASLARWRALLGEGVDVGALRVSADGSTQQVSLGLGTTELVLAAPVQAAGFLAQRLATRGEGPYAVVLSVPQQAVAGNWTKLPPTGCALNWHCIPAARWKPPPPRPNNRGARIAPR